LARNPAISSSNYCLQTRTIDNSHQGRATVYNRKWNTPPHFVSFQQANWFASSLFLATTAIIFLGFLRNERELLNAEISQSRSYIETLKDETLRLEAQIAHYRSKNNELQNLLSKEKQRLNATQEDNLHLSQTISTLQLDLEREKIDKKKLKEKYDIEMTRITSNKMSMSSSFTDYRGNSPDLFGHRVPDGNEEEIDQLRTRITALSQSLLEKQSLINGLSTDKQLLQINVERLHSQLQDMNQNSVVNDGLYTQSGWWLIEQQSSIYNISFGFEFALD